MVYADGVVSQKPFSGKPNRCDTPLSIGAYDDGSRPLIGLIDEVALFNTALGEEDIKSIMTNGLEKALGITPVFPIGKLTTTWVAIKAH